MNIPDKMKVALYYGKKPIGLAYSQTRNPYPNVYDTTWKWECLGETGISPSILFLFKDMDAVAFKHGLKRCNLGAGEGVTELYVPPQEDCDFGPIEGVDIDVQKVFNELKDEGVF